jgi:hypothetical protein
VTAADAWKERGGVGGDGDVATPPLCGRESQIWRRQSSRLVRGCVVVSILIRVQTKTKTEILTHIILNLSARINLLSNLPAFQKHLGMQLRIFATNECSGKITEIFICFLGFASSTTDGGE